MTNALVKVEKYQLAKMDTATLVETIDRSFANAKERARRIIKEVRDAKTPEEKKRAIMRLEDAQKTIDDYIEEQRAMFESRGMNKDRAFHEAIVPTGDVNENGVDIMRIVRRGTSIAPFDEGEEDVLMADRLAMEDREESWDDDGDGDGEWREARIGELM